MDVSLEEIQKAELRIRDHIYFSPSRLSDSLSQVTGQEVFLKLDNLQRTGAFKERGALNRILLLSEEEKRRGVIAASAGNHAQAVAYHATQRGVPSRIVMPLMTPLVKASATRGFGAEVILHGANYDEACTEAIRQSQADGLTFLQKIMSQHPIPTVICSTLTEAKSDMALQALERGAVEIITKPKLGTQQFFEESRTRICDAVKSAAG